MRTGFWCRRAIIVAVLLTLAGLGGRLYLVLRWPNDWSGDSILYRQMAKDLLEQRVYSIEFEAPYDPTMIRVPGYALFMAADYALFGHGNDRAVRVSQAVVDTATCWLVALLALLWSPPGWDAGKKRRALLCGLGLAAACPFTAVYTATILSETLAIFMAAAAVLAGTWALKGRSGLLAWVPAGLLAGMATMVRADLGLIAAAVGFTLTLVELRRALVPAPDPGGAGESRGGVMASLIAKGSAFSLAFLAVLAPWTVRNAAQFGLFQPIAPASAAMPQDFVAVGYGRWLTTWIDDERYIEHWVWNFEERPITLERVPGSAFDSPQERERVAALLEAYNHPAPKHAKGKTPAGAVSITPEIDAGFGAIADERIRRHPFRVRAVLPAKRMLAMWFDSHSDYYPFMGELFPLRELDDTHHQGVWLLLFLGLMWAYNLLAAAGAWVLWRDRASRRWLLLLALIFLPRLLFLSTIGNPEPRYTVELYPFLAAAAAIGMSHLSGLVPKKEG